MPWTWSLTSRYASVAGHSALLPRREIDIDAGPELVFPFFTEAELLARWLCAHAEIDARTGGAFALNVTGTHITRGTFRELAPGRRLVTFRRMREENRYYVDKTALCWRLVEEGDRYFLSRPRARVRPGARSLNMLRRFGLSAAVHEESARLHLEARQRTGGDRRDPDVQAERFPQASRR